MKKRYFASAVLVMLLAACNTPTPPSFSPSLGSTTLDIRQNTTSNLLVNFGRSNFSAPLTVQVNGLTDILISSAQVTSSDQSASLEFIPVAGTALNIGKAVTVEVSDGSTTKQLPLTVRVLPAQPNTLVDNFALGGVHLNSNLSVYRGVLVQSDDKILMLSSNKLFRYSSTGVLDSSFSGDGIADLPAGVAGYRLLLQDDGKILVIGKSSDNVKIDRFNTDGSLDPTFSAPLADADLGSIVGIGAARFSDDKTQIYVGVNTTQGVAIMRFLATGALDSGFGGADPGRIYLSAQNELYRVNALLPRANVIYVGGSTFQNGALKALLIALDNNGTLPSGKTKTFHFIAPNGNALSRSSIAQLLTSGQAVRVVGGGQTDLTNPEYNHIVSAELNNTTGLPLNTAFSSDGFESVALGFNATVDRILRDAAGKYLVMGGIQPSLLLTSSNTLATFYATRLNTDGTLDSTYGTNGIGRVKTVPQSNPYLEAAREDNQGNIVAVGGAGTVGMAIKFKP